MSSSLRRGSFGIGFLLSQLGMYASQGFAEAIEPLHVSPPHIGLLRAVGATPGRSQQSLADEFQMQPSRLVVLLDELETRGLVERRRDTTDRRVHTLHITDEGKSVMADAMRRGEKFNDKLLAALSVAQRKELHALLETMVGGLGLTPQVHPGYSRLKLRRAKADEPATELTD